MSFTLCPPLDEETRKKKEFKAEYRKILTQKLPNLQETLKSGICAFGDLELTRAAKIFRKLATDIKLTENLITSRGNYDIRNTLNDLTGKEWLQHTKSWVVVDGSPGDITEEIENHPASFPPELAEYYISYFTKQNQWVVDPFMGIGSTAAACWTTSRNCMGIDLNEQYISYARQRIWRCFHPEFSINQEFPPNIPDHLSDPEKNLNSVLFHGDVRQLISFWQKLNLPKCHFLLTSPPYWNMLRKSRGGVKSVQKQRIDAGNDAYYSELPTDLGNISIYETYLQELTQVFIRLKPLLEPKAYLMIILQNCRTPEGDMRPLAWDFTRQMTKDFILCQEFIWCQDQKFMGIWGWPTTYVSNVHHHYCLVFQNK